MTFQETILSSRDVCSNCFRRRRRAAVRHRSYEPDEEYSERVRWRTSVEEVPDVPASQQQTVFCDCGVDSAHSRIWDDDDVGEDRFGRLLANALITLGRLDEISSRTEARSIAERAWAARREGASVNDALERGVDGRDEEPELAIAD